MVENIPHRLIDFIPYGYDERQFCSPGIDLPVCNLSRVPYGAYPEYHTSGDNMDLVSEQALTDSLSVMERILYYIESERYFINLFPKGEPQLGRRGLYDQVGGRNDQKEFQMALLWVLNLSDGSFTLADIAFRAGTTIELIREAAELLSEKGLLKEILS
jgi:aminopeptidase-like protein